MIIKEKLIKEYPLTEKVEIDCECYKINSRKYVVFIDGIISNNEDDAKKLLDKLLTSAKTKCSTISTLIIVGKTNEKFKKEDLIFFDGVGTFAIYYLLNDTDGSIYFNDQGTYWFGANWKKIIKRFNEILKS